MSSAKRTPCGHLPLTTCRLCEGPQTPPDWAAPANPAHHTSQLLSAAGNAAASGELRRDEVGVPHTSFGVELQPLGFAPFGEIVRVQIHTENPDALCLESLAVPLGRGKPLIVGPMEYVTVFEHGAKNGEGFTSEPRKSSNLNLHSSSTDGTGATIGQPAAQPGAFVLPPLNDDLREILGRPNFACHEIARLLRRMGHEIAERAEAEQAAVIYWMLTKYAAHGRDWWPHCRDDLQAAIDGKNATRRPA